MFQIEKFTWEDYKNNPLISPPFPDAIIADPSVVTPKDSPDSKWHLFAHGLLGLYHFISTDGLEWQRLKGLLFFGFRPYIYVENGFHLLYEKFIFPNKTGIFIRHSTDLVTWSEPKLLLDPQYSWEGKYIYANGNPCLIKVGDDYRLYFSASWLWCYLPEPSRIGYASSKSVDGPYVKNPEPLNLESPKDSSIKTVLGSGSLKVLSQQINGLWYGFSNQLIINNLNDPSSQIYVYTSRDGLDWRLLIHTAIVGPDKPWKKTFVYAMHPIIQHDEIYLYYNARDGWLRAKEHIGLVIGHQ